MSPFRRSTLLVVLLATGSIAAAATIHVSPSGTDGGAGDGSSQNPYLTINYAIQHSSAGDTILLEAGATFAQNVYVGPGDGGSPTEPLTISADTANRATIQGDGSAPGLHVWNTAGIEIENLIIDGPGPSGATNAGIALQADDANHTYARVRNVDVSGYKDGIIVQGWGGTGFGFSDVVIEDSTFHHNLTGGGSTWASTVGGISDVTVRRCAFHDNYGDPSAASHTGSGFVIGCVENGLMEHCIAYGNGEACTTTGGPVALWTYDSTNVTIQFCEAYNNHAVNCDGGGFDLDGGAQDCVIQYCYSHDNDGAGYLICQYDGARAFTNNTIRYCISQNDGRRNGFGGLHFWSSGSNGGLQNTRVYGNTIFNEYSHVVRFQNTSGQFGTTIWNNIFVSNNSTALVSGSPSTSVAALQGNCYFAVDGNYDMAGHETLDAWRTASDQEKLNTEAVGMQNDPGLESAGSGGTIGDTTQLSTLSAYHLATSSPCIDAGLDLPTQFSVDVGTRDFYGNNIPAGDGLSIGAHDRAAGATSTPAIDITAPVGAVRFIGKQDALLSWMSFNLAGSVDVDYSIDGGAWQSIATEQAQTGGVTWEVANVDTSALLIRVRGIGAGDGSDQSSSCTISAIDDTDADRLDDAWEVQHFGDLNTADATTDTDTDGSSDLVEFWSGTDPATDPDGGSDGSSGCVASTQTGEMPWATLAWVAAISLLRRGNPAIAPARSPRARRDCARR